MTTSVDNLSPVTIKWQAMTDLSNRVSKQQLHFMTPIIVTALKIVTHETFWNGTT